MTAADDLRAAVAALTQARKSKIMLEREFVPAGQPGTVEAVVPSLLEQLEDAAEQGTEGGGVRSVPGSRPPTGLDLLDVRCEILDGIAHRRHHLELPHVDEPGPALAGYAEELIRRSAMISFPEVTEESLLNLRYTVGTRWRRLAEQVLAVEYRARELRGMPCPAEACHEKWFTPAPGETRQAALYSVLGQTGVPRAMECRCCGTVWWAGAVLEEVGAAYRAWTAAARQGVKKRTVDADAGALAVRGRPA